MNVIEELEEQIIPRKLCAPRGCLVSFRQHLRTYDLQLCEDGGPEVFRMNDDDNPSNFCWLVHYMAADDTSSESGDSHTSDYHGDSWERFAWLEAKNDIVETGRDTKYDRPLEVGKRFQQAGNHRICMFFALSGSCR